MVVGKDFGDALKYGKSSVSGPYDRAQKRSTARPADLTAEISIFSNEILVGAAAMRAAAWRQRFRSRKRPGRRDSELRYSGSHGSFQNNVRFSF
jgi:hypothetical protein